MNKTTNYKLPHWESSDRILMDDFNNMTEGIDTALAENKSAIEAAEASCNSAIEAVAAAAGNCKVITGTYTGTGTYSNDATAVKLTFEKKPFLLFILGSNNYWACMVNMKMGHSFYGTDSARDMYGNNSGKQYWWTASGNAACQMNSSNVTYTYWAFVM